MTVKLLGVRPVKFPDKETGEVVEGLSLYIAYPDEDVYGVVADKKFVIDDTIERLKVSREKLIEAIDTDINIETNPRGRLSAIVLCQKKAQ